MHIRVSMAAMAEWLRRWTRNPMGSSRVGSNPTRSALFFFLFCRVALNERKERKRKLTHVFLLGELSQFFVSKSPFDRSSKTGKFSISINGPSTVFLDANETEYGYDVRILLYKFT
jgi:hypothetical protein